MPKIAYDPDLKATPEWKFLYYKWMQIRKLEHSDDFNNFLDFYNWAMSHGYVCGAKLGRLYDSKPYSPDNCLWDGPMFEDPNFTEEQKMWISKWNEAVNRIRRHYGMEPLEQIYDGSMPPQKPSISYRREPHAGQ